jgi:aspartyl-tRNA(Asn)/glutamyl-tRNA(Gln) amidotransferase subunit C
MAKLSNEDVLKLAELARITLDEQEVASFQEEINEVLSYVEQLQEVDLSDQVPTSQVTGLENVTRDDVIEDYGYSRDDLLSNTPELTKTGYIKVKRVLS